jgi:uncharacterized protein (TIGR00251 family)
MSIDIDILVQPRSAKEEFGPVHDDRIKVYVKAPPVDGAANQAVIRLLSQTFGVAKRNIEVVRGHSSRRKTVRIVGVSLEEVVAEASKGT